MTDNVRLAILVDLDIWWHALTPEKKLAVHFRTITGGQVIPHVD